MTDIAHRVLEAVMRAVDASSLERELASIVRTQTTRPPPTPPPPAGGSGAAAALHDRMVLSDILDDGILGARAGDKAFPLRVFFSRVGEALVAGDDTAFSLLCALNFHFRVSMDEEVKMRLAVEASRQYYRFVREQSLEGREKISPLLASLLSTELSRVKLESVDHQVTFDSAAHERDDGSDAASAKIVEPRSFVCRVAGTGNVRVKAAVLT